MSVSDLDSSELIGRLVLCAVDQMPFDSGPNTFCVLTPLMTDEGERFDDRRQYLFPNRGRIWWMLRREIDPKLVLPGVLYSARLERAPKEELDRPEKDQFQARRDTVPGSSSYLEVLRLDHDLDPKTFLDRPVIEHDRPTTSRVLVAGTKALIGPWAAEWDPASKRLTLRALLPGRPTVWRAPLKKIPGSSLMDFSFTANEWDKREPTRTIQITVAPESLLGTLEKIGEEIDAADDPQVMNWGLKLLGISRNEQQRIKAVIDRSSELAEQAADAPPGRLERFRGLCESAERVMNLGGEVARLIGEQEAFRSLLEQHLESVLQKQIAREVERRRGEIERGVRELEEKRTRLERDLEQLEREFAERDKQLEQQLRENQARREQELEEREQEIEKRGQRLAEREQQLREQTEQLQEAYDERSEQIYRRLVEDLPVLTRLGLTPGSQGSSPPADPPARTPEASREVSLLPDYLQRPRERGELSEPDFLDQFARVASYRGFVFDRDDLANIHVATKVGLWTVLAGPSGTGKSSLPRLYAEALGVTDELLFVPVRPDWMDDRDVLGGFNALSGRYEPSASGLVDLLIAANEDERRERGGLYFVCLDEMNLSRVEHYFAHFLSVMERPKATRALELFAAGLERRGDPYAPYRRLILGDNIRFIGTVNIDETSYFFSPRVIDRASLILLEEPDLTGSNVPVNDDDRLGGLAPVHRSEYESWIRAHDQAPKSARVLLLELDEVLRRARSGLAHRTFRRFLRFVASAEGLLTEDRAFDLAFAQIVVPRLKASAFGFGAMIDALRERLPDSRFPRSARLLERLAEAEGEYDFFQLL